MARDMATRFNQTFREVFIIPEADINHETQLVSGIDGRKMSKSYENTIPIFCDEKTLKKQVMSIVTDSTPISKPKSIDSPIFQIYSLFLDENEKIELKNRFKTPGLKYGDVKNEIFERIWIYFEPYRTNRVHLINNKDYVENILSNGAKKASEIGEFFLEKVRNAVGLNY
jgi:tryptophanyl-tRNA synthetase